MPRRDAAFASSRLSNGRGSYRLCESAAKLIRDASPFHVTHGRLGIHLGDSLIGCKNLPSADLKRPQRDNDDSRRRCGLGKWHEKMGPTCAICWVFVDESGFRLSKIGHSWLPTPWLQRLLCRRPALIGSISALGRFLRLIRDSARLVPSPPCLTKDRVPSRTGRAAFSP